VPRIPTTLSGTVTPVTKGEGPIPFIAPDGRASRLPQPGQVLGRSAASIRRPHFGQVCSATESPFQPDLKTPRASVKIVGPRWAVKAASGPSRYAASLNGCKGLG